MDELWSDLARILTRHHSQPEQRDANEVARNVLDYVEFRINEQRLSQRLDPIYVRVTTEPPAPFKAGGAPRYARIIGTIVPDDELGNRVEFIDGVPAYD